MSGLLLLTFRELTAKKVIVGLFVVATFVWLMLTFALNLDVVDGALASVRLFGQEQAVEQEVEIRNEETGEVETRTVRPFGENPLQNIVVTVEQVVAGITFWVVLLLGLFATGTLVASLLERGQIDLLLAKPVGRSSILAGRVLGVLAVVAALVAYLFGAVWVVMSVKSGIWHAPFLLALGVVLAMFAVMYGLVTLVSVWTESAALALIVTLGVIVASLVLTAGPEEAHQLNRPWRDIYVALYHVMPKFPRVTQLTWQLTGGGAVTSWYPFWSSLLFGAAAYAGAFTLFRRKDF